MRKSTTVITTVIIVLVFAAGVGIMLYPTLSNLWNAKEYKKEISSYSMDVDSADDALIKEATEAAREYNKRLCDGEQSFLLSDEERSVYESLLCMPDTDVMGYIDIPKIDCRLPIYHGTSEEVLVKGIGHVEGSSLPVGGESTHCVLSGHRGLPSAKLFSDLNSLEVGDRFTVSVLGEDLTYEVDEINVVLPSETEKLLIADGEDLCTLVTCTPYGINSHRLLVRGKRILN